MRRHPLLSEVTRVLVVGTVVCGVLFVWHGDTTSNAAGPDEIASAIQLDACFSPDGGCESRIISEIRGARKSIRVQMYLFTSKKIADALIEAAEREVDVRVVLDVSEKKQRWSKWRDLKKGGVKVRLDGDHATANSKVMLIDDDTVITGSYNYTKAAETKNSENIIIIKGDRALFDKFLRNFEEHAEHSK
jgi:phosphatidylserine/phosphatidylglycerophosphate/cardiolipin synthase-like enzyme